MPRTFPNVYAAESPIGQGLYSIAQMLLADDGGAKAALQAAQMRAHLAHADKLRADAEQTSYQTDQSRNFLNNAARNLVGDNGQQALRFIQGAVDTVPGYDDPERQMTVAPTTAPVQRPANLDANTERTLRQLAVLAPAAAPNAGMNMDNLAKSITEMTKGAGYQDMLDGKVDPGRYYVASGGAPFKFDDSYVGNMMTGAQNLNELGKAKVGTEREHQGAYGAAANASNANARQSDRKNQLVDIPNPLDPNTKIRVPASELYRQTNANKRNEETIAGRENVASMRNAEGKLLPNGEKPINLNAQAMKDIQRIALAMLNDYQNPDDKLRASSATPDEKTGINPNVAVDSALLAKIMGDATALASNPASGFGGNVPGAVQNAMENAIAQGLLKVERTDNQYNPIGDRKVRLSFAGSQPITTAPSIVPPSQRVEAQGAPAAPAQQTSKPTVGEVRKGYRFKGGDPASKAAWEKV